MDLQSEVALEFVRVTEASALNKSLRDLTIAVLEREVIHN
jgi:fructose-1,6-bisphosphatase/sedoheptulose 1,7-bisphosphatase-like protein